MVNPNYNPNYYYYPGNYQPPVIQQPPIPQVPQNQILAWVQNEDEAEKYPLNAGQSIFLMSQRDPYLYMKSVDQLGKTTFIKKRLVDESDNQEASLDLTGYIKKEEVENLIFDIVRKEVEKRVSQISFKPTRKKIVNDDDED